MSIGSNIKRLRENRRPGQEKMTQEKLADLLGVSFQAVSAWERDEYLPELSNAIKLADIFGVSLSAIVEDKIGLFKTKDAIYNWEHMKTFIKTTARNHKLPNTLAALDYAVEKHAGVTRKNTDVPYIYHPLTVACHALAMGFADDEIIAASLLHDVVEDCFVTPEDLPVTDEIREIVRLLTHPDTYDSSRDESMDAYYSEIRTNVKAVLIKCLDRCNNMTTMAWGLSRDRIYRYIRETEKYYPALLDTLKETIEYNNAYWLLKYQIESMLDIYKRLM